MTMSNKAGAKPAASEGVDASVLFESHSASRTYRLNRPKALHTLDSSIVDPLAKKIKDWKESDLCQVIIGVGDSRAFCAGGDVKAVAQAVRAGKTKEALEFFRTENELDYALAKLNKPYVVFMEGITMGGGAGLAYPAPLRIATTTTHFAMPETGIGFAPDVGSQFYLTQLDGSIGAWMAVTGESIYGRAVYELGLATHYVPQRAISDLLFAIQQFENPTVARLAALIASYSAPPFPASGEATYSSKSTPDAPTPFTGSVRILLDKAFSQSSVAGIYKVLNEAANENVEGVDARAKEWAKKQIETMNTRSPTGMKVALASHRQAAKQRSLGTQLNNDLSMCAAFLNSPSNDMVDSIFHKLIDKQKTTPTWKPADINDPSISDESILPTWFDRATSSLLSTAPSMKDTSGDRTTVPWGQFRAWGLPSEAVIKSYVDGSARGSGAFALTEEQVKEALVADLSEKFEMHAELAGEWKEGLRERVSEVVQRRCTVEEGHTSKYLKWKS